MLFDEVQRRPLSLTLGNGGGAHALYQARLPVRRLVPLIHRTEALLTLVNRQHRADRERFQLTICNDRRHLDNSVLIGIETGHLEVDPDEVAGVLRHGE